MLSLDDAHRSQRDRFRRACPEAARAYDLAETDFCRLASAFQRAAVASSEEEAIAHAKVVAVDMVRAAQAWALARRNYERFVDLDVAPIVVPRVPR